MNLHAMQKIACGKDHAAEEEVWGGVAEALPVADLAFHVGCGGELKGGGVSMGQTWGHFVEHI
jgi:hypothetical protein